jgi:hypothetical protein
MVSSGSRGPSLVALGFFLARRGFTALVGLSLAVANVVGFGGLAFYLARRGRLEALASLPLLASTALAFAAGVLVAFAASTRVFRRDEDEGVRALLAARGVSTAAYLAARVSGLAVLLAVLVGGGSALVGLVATLAARGRTTALHTAQASLAAIAFGVAFAIVFAPVAIATLGARSRAGGYLALLGVLVLPELLCDLAGASAIVPQRWLDVCSIPGALLAVRTALAPVGVDPFMLGRGLIALGVVVIGALLVVTTELASSRRARIAERPRP